MIEVYIAASTQDKNLGLGDYGNEQDRMHQLADKVKYYIENGGHPFKVFRNEKNWTLKQTCDHCVSSGAVLFIDNHTNAGSPTAQGPEVFYHGERGEKSTSFEMASILYENIMAIYPLKGRGVKPDTSLYKNGLSVIRNTVAAACLIEHVFHTNAFDVAQENFVPAFFLNNINLFAKAEAQAVYMYFGLVWTDPETKTLFPQDNAFNYLNKNGVRVFERRYDEPLTRGDGIELLARLFNRITGIPRD